LPEKICLLCGKPLGPGHSLSCGGSEAKADAPIGTAGVAESRIQAQIIVARDLLEEAKSLGVDVSEFEKKLSHLERLRPENLGGPIASLMSDISKAVEESKPAEEKDAASIAAKVESQLVVTRHLLEEARSLGADISRFETGFSKLATSLGESRSETTRLRQLLDSADTFIAELSEVIESSRRELEKEPTELEAEVYEYLMKHGGMSVSAYSKEHGISDDETKKAIDRLVELDMIEVRKV